MKQEERWPRAYSLIGDPQIPDQRAAQRFTHGLSPLPKPSRPRIYGGGNSRALPTNLSWKRTYRRGILSRGAHYWLTVRSVCAAITGVTPFFFSAANMASLTSWMLFVASMRT